jgi:hypothetical protein
VRLARLMGREPATPAEARDIIGLSGGSQLLSAFSDAVEVRGT